MSDPDEAYLDCNRPGMPELRRLRGGARFVLAERDVERDITTGFPTLILTRVNEAPRRFKLTPTAARKVAALLLAAADEHDAEMGGAFPHGQNPFEFDEPRAAEPESATIAPTG